MLQTLFEAQLRHYPSDVSRNHSDGAPTLHLQAAPILVDKNTITKQLVTTFLFSKMRVPRASTQPLAETKTGRMPPAWWRICGVLGKPNIIFL